MAEQAAGQPIVRRGLMSGKVRRPVLLVAVYGIFLALVAVTATAHAVLVSAHFSSASIDALVARDRSLVRLYMATGVSPSDLSLRLTDRDRLETLEAELAALVEHGEILRLSVRDPRGRIVLSSEPGLRGRSAPVSDAFAAATRGEASAVILDDAREGEVIGPPLDAEVTVREYLPLVDADGDVIAVFAIWRDAAPLLASLDGTRAAVVLVTLVAALVLAAVLFLIFRTAHRRLVRQTEDLLEATRRDALTGMYNHGAVVTLLAQSVDAAGRTGQNITIALVDIDNFRSLNDTHGHEAGDATLLEVAELLRETAPPESVIGRYGPDEFLVVSSPDSAGLMEAAMEQMRSRMRDVTLRFTGSEDLPVTISAGLCTYPTDEQAVTDLLVAASVAVGEAKASGGDAVRVASAHRDERAVDRSFDVLKGLVFAVDTKDRYTKRHSEDVARYAVFLAQRMGLPEDELRTIHTAGLLHDVGKIGIPDALLRKPGKLTAQEQDIFRQHVALGDMIVRDLPDIEAVRLGVRHHHERWDGHGYLDGLEAEGIPLIARILAVADAFSAMTTTRPYRKALPVEEALKRLTDAAATQLEERLVVAFVTGIETDANAPLPGAEPAPLRLWTPRQMVA